MDERMSLPVVSCDGCGACCLTQGFPPELPYLFGEPVDGQPADDETLWRNRKPSPWMRSLPVRLAAEIDAYFDARRRDVIPTRDGGPCLWLDVETRRCRHYEYRPAPCRALPVGGADCLTWRAEAGLSCPPEPDPNADPDWLENMVTQLMDEDE
jgi:uncharacterized protein